VSEDPVGFRGGMNEYAYVGSDPPDFVDSLGTDRNPFKCAATNASKVSFASLTGLGSVDGVTGFAANALGGNTFSGVTNLLTTLGSADSTDQQVLTQMVSAELRGPLQGILASLFGVTGPAAVNPAGMLGSAMLGNAFDAVTGADSSIISLSGGASLASTAMTGAEFATGFGEAKFIYDGLTYFGSLGLCAAGALNQEVDRGLLDVAT